MPRGIQNTNPWTDKDVEAHWDRVASIYIQENERVKATHDQRFRESIMLLKLFPGARVLNITSRDAGAEDYLKAAELSAMVTHAEISAGLMQVASKIRPHINQVKLNDYRFLPFGDGSFDRVLSLETLEHVSEPVKFLRELHRVSTPEARLVLSCPPASSEIPYRVYTALFGGHGEGPHRFPASREVKEMFKATGWKLLLHKGTILVPAGPAWLQRLGENIIEKCQGSFIAELGIRQFFCCEKA